MTLSMNRSKGLTRRAIAGGGVTGALALLAACNAPGSSEQAPGGGRAGQRDVTLRWSTWGNQSSPMVEASAKGAAIFTQKFPRVKVEPEPQLSGWPEKIYSEMVAGTAPDVIGGCCSTLPSWARKGVLLNLEPLVKRDWKAAQIKDFHELQYNYFTDKQAGRFAVPMYMGTSALYYNKERFKRAGVAFPDESWDWNKWRDAMTRLTNISREEWGAYLRLSGGERQILLNANGGNMVDPKDDTRSVLDQRPALEALQWIRDRMWADNVAIQRPQEQGNNFQMLARGRVAMLIAGSWSLTTMIQAADQAEWDVALLPKGPVERRNRATVDGWTIWKESKSQAEAWELHKFLQTDEWWDTNMPITGQQPTRISLQTKYAEVMKKSRPQLADKKIEVFGDPVSKGYARPQEIFRLEDDAAPIVTKAWTDAVLDNKVAVSDAFKQATQEINTLHRMQLGSK
jgi:multiple sugar transport system substrate-binding protein